MAIQASDAAVRGFVCWEANNPVAGTTLVILGPVAPQMELGSTARTEDINVCLNSVMHLVHVIENGQLTSKAREQIPRELAGFRVFLGVRLSSYYDHIFVGTALQAYDAKIRTYDHLIPWAIEDIVRSPFA